MTCTDSTTKKNDSKHELTNYPRPVVIIGPFKQILMDELNNNQPDKFDGSVPHTSRPKREGEVDGWDYHFVTREQMENYVNDRLFMEAGKYHGNIYGTTFDSIRKVLNDSKHCLLDITNVKDLERLINAGFHPFVIFIKPRDAKWIMNNSKEEISEKDAQELNDKSKEILLKRKL